MVFLLIFQNFKNWVRQSWENVRNAQNIFSAKYATPIRNIVAKKSNLAKILGQMVRISQKFIIIFIKNLLKNTTVCVTIVINDK